MEELLMSDNLLPGIYSGAFEDGYQWAAVLDIAENPAETEEEAAISEKMPVMLVTINLAITWTLGCGKKVTGFPRQRSLTNNRLQKKPGTFDIHDADPEHQGVYPDRAVDLHDHYGDDSGGDNGGIPHRHPGMGKRGTGH
ncbi:MAG: hypothetical protein R2874_06485 [Desulfobacterales bacterium]